MKFFRLVYRSSPRLAGMAAAAGVVSGLCNAGLLAMINEVLFDRDSGTTQLALFFALLVLLRIVSHATSQILLNKFAHHTTGELRRRLTRKILSAPLQEVERLGTPRLLASLTDDVLVITDAFRALPRLAVNAAILVACSAYLAWLSWALLGGVALFGLAGVFTYKILLREAMRSMASARDVQDGLFSHFRSLTEGIKELKLHARRRKEFVENGIDASTRQFETHLVDAFTRLAITFGWSQLIYFTLIGLILFAAPVIWAIDGRTLTGYAVTTLYLMGPLTIVLDAIPVMGQAGVAIKKIDSLGLDLEAVTEPPQSELAFRHDGEWRSLELRDLGFTYDSEENERAFRLGPLNLELKPKQVLFLVGGNGSGKSTLSKLLTGLFIPDEGEIVFDGETINDSNREWYRQHFSAVFSDFYLFESFIGLQTQDVDQRAARYLKKLDLHEKVEVKDGRLSTTSLSQGQRKRLALLTAYLEDRPIYVFDEWAADQDPEFKEIFYRELLDELKERGKAVVVISHDDRYFDVADRMIRLDDGRLEKRAAGEAAGSLVSNDDGEPLI